MTIVLVVLNDDQLCRQGALKILRLATVIVCHLEAHEGGCDWLSGIHSVEDGVGCVVSIKRGGHSVGWGGATVEGSDRVSIMAVT